MIPDEHLLIQLQEGIPLVPRPFDVVAQRAGYGYEEVIQVLNNWKVSGRMRRFGAVFDSRRLGYSSTLCAASVPAGELDDAVAPLIADHRVTHCYERDCELNLWFTFTAARGVMEESLEQLRKRFSRWPMYDVPALRRFKVNVIFGNDTAVSAKVERDIVCHAGLEASLDETDRGIVRALQGDIPICRDLFGVIADSVGRDRDSLLLHLNKWHDRGILKRIGALLFHYQFGFSANGMCVWRVHPDAIETIGKRLAASTDVSHCYERRMGDGFPYNLFAMVHARSASDARLICDRLTRDIVGAPSRMLLSTKEHVKRSSRFFVDDFSVPLEP